MDRKDKVLGIFFISAALLLWGLELRRSARSETVEAIEEAYRASEEQELAGDVKAFAAQIKQAKSTSGGLVVPVSGDSEALGSKAVKEEPTLAVLENSVLRVTFSSVGGAISSVVFKDYPSKVGSDELYRFDHEDYKALGLFFKDSSGALTAYEGPFNIIYQDASRIQWSCTTEEGVEIIRAYSLAKEGEARDPYLIFHETTFNNPSSQAFSLPKVFMGLGLVPYESVDVVGYYLNVGYLKGEKVLFKDLGSFLGSKGFLGMGSKEPRNFFEDSEARFHWVSVKNQFFASVLTPPEPAVGVYGALTHLQSGEQALTACLGLGAMVVPANDKHSLQMRYYTGPKAYTRLEQLGHGEEGIMQFGPLAFISKLLLVSMIGIHSFVGNWGVTIILLTCVIKLLLWPLTLKATNSSRRMAQLQAPMKALREKYKSNPQKMQREIAQLFKKHGVNPAAGCLPLLVQIPIFLGLFWMLRSASELRFASFLWVKDLSAPDTVAMLGSVPLNIMPLLMGVTMFFQMKLTPSPSADEIQQKVFRFMPFIFLFICYNFSSGLVLYWTVQNLITILQQELAKRTPLTDPNVLDKSSQSR